MTKLSYLEAIRQAHDLALEKNKNTFRHKNTYRLNVDKKQRCV